MNEAYNLLAALLTILSTVATSITATTAPGRYKLLALIPFGIAFAFGAPCFWHTLRWVWS